ncbi:MAG: M23 family metallopeptidase [Oscillospiraceae bacterium]
MVERNKYKRTYKKQQKPDVIFNTMIYQIVMVALIVGFLIYSAQSPYKMLNDFVEEVKNSATISISQLDLEKLENEFNIEEFFRQFFSEQIKGQGGKPNPFRKIGGEKLVAAPKGNSFAPILVSMPINPPISGEITSSYGYRIHPITKEEDFHTGIDIAAPKGKAIQAILDGVVTDSGYSPSYGNYIILKHCSGFTSFYCHCDEILAPIGTVIKKGERIAKVGTTGISTGPHLHFEIKYEGISYDPMWLLREE